MTNIEAIKSTVAGYPLSDNTFQRVLTDRGLSATDAYTGKTQSFELATADLYMTLATAANISEGGYSISIQDKAAFIRLAEAIFSKYDDVSGTSPTATDATMRW